MPIYKIQCKNCLFEEERIFKHYNSLWEYLCPMCGMIAWNKRPTNFSWSFGEKLKKLT